MSIEKRKQFVADLEDKMEGDVKKSDILDELEDEFDITRGGLRAFLNRHIDDLWWENADTDADTKECPDCGVAAEGEEQIDEIFGYRKVSGNKYVQSYCRECR